MEKTSRRPCILDSALMLRLVKVAARSSTMIWSTRPKDGGRGAGEREFT